MIKVNLIGETRGAEVRREWVSREQRPAALGLTLLLVTGVGVTGWWWHLRQERTAVEASIVAAESELVRLREAAVLVEQASQRTAELSERLALIERLRTAKRGPVDLIETVSLSIPDGLWLLEIKQTGANVQVDGRAMSLTAVTDFAARLQTSGLFKHPVEIVTTVAETYEQVEVVRFVVRAEAVGTIAPVADATGAAVRPGA